MSLLISPEGKIIETEIEIDFNELPKAAQNALKGKQTKEICRITDFKGKITYMVEVRRKDYLFASDGRILQTN